MPVLMILRINERARKFPSASHVPTGRPMSKLIAVADEETCNDRSVICQISELKTIG
jgi:hypothetical protein